MAAADGSRPQTTEPRSPRTGPLATLVYRSRAARPMSESDLAGLMIAAKRRNRAESLTGLVVYDRECFLQWLEGPPDSLARVARSIRNDPRHTDIEILSEHRVPARVFEGWDMQLALGPDGPDALRLPAISPPAEILHRMHRFPESAAMALASLAPLAPGSARARDASATAAGRRDVLDRLLGEAVLPELRSRHVTEPASRQTAAHDPVARELAALVGSRRRGEDSAAPENLCRRTTASLEALADLVERTTRVLGDGWRRGRWSGFDISIALCTLQGVFRRLSPSLRALETGSALRGRALVTPAPGESHILGSILKCDLLAAQGWEVPRFFAPTCDDLESRLATERHEILVLSLSHALRRDERLASLTETIARARRASCNPALAVVVGGRIFRDEPASLGEVGADAACRTVSMIGISVAEAVGTTLARPRAVPAA